MAISYNLLTVHIDLTSIRRNYRLLAAHGPRLMPVIKADAYGHGLEAVAGTLIAAGADTLCVGTVTEAARLRRMPFDGGIVALLGPLTDGDYALAREHELVCVVGRMEQLTRLHEAAAGGSPLRIALKFDTGMSRLGFQPGDVQTVAQALGKYSGVRLEMLFSHLATADEEDHGYLRDQAERFATIAVDLRTAGHTFRACLANSAAILAHPDVHYDLQRPGIALYGANPLVGTPVEALGRELVPAMSVSAPVLEVHDLSRGGCVSYGCTFTAGRDMRVAIVAAGYADGYSRGLSNTGQMCIGGQRAPILGRVCMQLTAVDVSGLEVRPGDTAWLLGGGDEGRITPEELAGWWGTIPYEVFCVLGLNRRVYHS